MRPRTPAGRPPALPSPIADDGDEAHFCRTCAFAGACLSVGYGKLELAELHCLVEHVGPYRAGERIFRTGPVGSGHAMKALNNFLGATAYAAGVEALAIGKQFGLDPQVMLDVVNTSTGRSFNSEVVLKDEVITGRYGTGFALGLLAKDVGIAADLADSLEADAPTLRLVRSRWADAAAGLGFSADHSEAHKAWWPDDLSAGPAGGTPPA